MAKPQGRPRGATRNAPKPAKSTAKTAPKKSPSFGVLLLCLLPVVALLWLLIRLEGAADKTPRANNARKPPAVQAEAKRAPAKPPVPKYEFYETLPKGHPSIPPARAQQPKTATKPAPAPPKAEKIEVARAHSALRGEVPPPRIQYFLQAGSFKSSEEAEQLRAQLALLGQRTRLEQGKVSGQTWHRVMVGPFASQQQLAQTRKQLGEQGFSQQMLSQQRRAP